MDAVGRLEARYDPEHDVTSPSVSYTEAQLLEMVRRLVIAVEDLQDQINNIQGR